MALSINNVKWVGWPVPTPVSETNIVDYGGAEMLSEYKQQEERAERQKQRKKAASKKSRRRKKVANAM